MPRTNPKSLIIAVDGININNSILDNLREKGHDVIDIESQEFREYGVEEADVIIGPRCWRIDARLKLGNDATAEESLLRQVEMMIKGVRAIKFPREVKI